MTDAERIGEAVGKLNEFLAASPGRNVYSRSEVVDLALDLQIVLVPTGASTE